MYLEYLICSDRSNTYIYFYNKEIKFKLTTALSIYFYRAIFSIVYIFYANNNPADANMYIMEMK